MFFKLALALTLRLHDPTLALNHYSTAEMEAEPAPYTTDDWTEQPTPYTADDLKEQPTSYTAKEFATALIDMPKCTCTCKCR